MDPVTLMTVGTVVEGFAQYGANIQQAIAEAANARYYAEQERFNIAATLRAVDSAARESGYKVGQAITAYTGSGLDVGAGSAITNIATLIADGIAEVDFARRKGELDIQLARMRRTQSEQTAAMLESPGYNLVQFGTTLLGNMTKAESTSQYNTNQARRSGTSLVTSPNSYLTGSSQGSGTGYLGTNLSY